MIYPQMLLDLEGEIVVDLFAGGGGASCGIEMALGRPVDVAVNHDPEAVAMHRINHPQTKHYRADVFEVDPRKVTGGRPVGLLWASPDCTFHSKARGAKPIRSKDKKRRALAWVVTRWAGQVRPRVIKLENVEEFADWGPLVGPPHAQRPCPRRRGRTFRKWVRSLKRLGYQVEWRERRACDSGAPTIRKRLYLIARCDGRPIVWPAATHGPGRPLPYRTAAECIDWSEPMLSIFATREEAKAWGRAHKGKGTPVRPLAEATMRRIARGVMRYVVENPEPYIVGVGGRAGQSPERSTRVPYQTITAKGDAALVVPNVVHLTHQGARRAHSTDEPLPTVTSAQRGEMALVASELRRPTWEEWYAGTKDYGGTREEYDRLYGDDPDGGEGPIAPVIVPNNTNNAPHAVDAPVPTVTGGGRNMLAAATLVQTGYGERKGQAPRALDIKAPLGTIVGGAAKHALVSAFLAQHNTGMVGHSVTKPVSTIVQKGCTQGLVAGHLTRFNQNGIGQDAREPLDTALAGATRFGAVAAFLQAYYGTGNQQSPGEPLFTIPTVDRFGLVTVEFEGQTYALADIAMRMLQPRELYRAQGFPDSYIIDRGLFRVNGNFVVRTLTKSAQVRMCGNSVSPYEAAALVRANLPELIVRDAALPAVPKKRRARRPLAGVA